MNHQNYENYIPSYVINKLYATQKEELQRVSDVLLTDDNSLALRFSYEHLKTSNPALWFLTLRTTWKYNIADNELVKDDDLRKLFEYDRTHLDGYHEVIFSHMTEEEILFEQAFSTMCSFLKSRNIEPQTVEMFLNTLIEMSKQTYGYTPSNTAQLIAHVLTDKWEPKRFKASTLKVLVTLFERCNLESERKTFQKILNKKKR